MSIRNKYYKAMDDGLLDPMSVAEMCMQYMGYDEPEDMARFIAEMCLTRMAPAELKDVAWGNGIQDILGECDED